ncbi:MAG: hypothetical protein H0Z39_03655 [Peptococcaceae bacterium]|nr:hypothetical protein [Peptococcaceae bacterium]
MQSIAAFLPPIPVVIVYTLLLLWVLALIAASRIIKYPLWAVALSLMILTLFTGTAYCEQQILYKDRGQAILKEIPFEKYNVKDINLISGRNWANFTIVAEDMTAHVEKAEYKIDKETEKPYAKARKLDRDLPVEEGGLKAGFYKVTLYLPPDYKQ